MRFAVTLTVKKSKIEYKSFIESMLLLINKLYNRDMKYVFHMEEDNCKHYHGYIQGKELECNKFFKNWRKHIGHIKVKKIMTDKQFLSWHVYCRKQNNIIKHRYSVGIFDMITCHRRSKEQLKKYIIIKNQVEEAVRQSEII